jgi:hypothetical protein
VIRWPEKWTWGELQELYTDLAKVQGIDAVAEFNRILEEEITAEINQQIIDTINNKAKKDTQNG